MKCILFVFFLVVSRKKVFFASLDCVNSFLSCDNKLKSLSAFGSLCSLLTKVS